MLTILVFGGSRGAESINRGICALLPTLARLERAPRIVHQTGPVDEARVRREYAAYPAGRWQVHAFIDDMPQRLSAADVVVCRAGATTIAELAAAGRPAILVPYPHAADDHQRHNAEALVDSGAAVMVEDRELETDRLLWEIERLLKDADRRLAIARAARALAKPEAAATIVSIAGALLDGRPPEAAPFAGGKEAGVVS